MFGEGTAKAKAKGSREGAKKSKGGDGWCEAFVSASGPGPGGRGGVKRGLGSGLRDGGGLVLVRVLGELEGEGEVPEEGALVAVEKQGGGHDEG